MSRTNSRNPATRFGVTKWSAAQDGHASATTALNAVSLSFDFALATMAAQGVGPTTLVLALMLLVPR